MRVLRPHASVRACLFLIACLAACAGPPTPESEKAVRELWNQYLASKQGPLGYSSVTASPFWSASEQKRWPLYDLASTFLPNDAFPEVLSVTPVDAAADTAYRIETRFWADAASARDSSAQPVITTTVYARRERGRWVLTGALPYHTSTWARETRGRIDYVVAPAMQFNPAKAEGAAAFVDSLAAAFDVEPPSRIEYYVTESVDQAMEILGAVSPQRFGPNGGFARPGRVFSGIPALGEDYRHELAHVLLAPVIGEHSSSLIASEGVPTWFGGTAGRDFTASVQHLAARLRAEPTLDLHAVVYDITLTSDVRNAAGAVLTDMLFHAAGTDALREFLQTPGHGVPVLLERVLQRPWERIEADWRRRVDEIAAA